MTIESKWIVIEDIGRELIPIGYNFRSPILTPAKFQIDTIRQLLTTSKVTRMFEVYEADKTLRVQLTSENFRTPFEELWKQQNPEKVFPWENTVEVQLQNELDVVNGKVDDRGSLKLHADIHHAAPTVIEPSQDDDAPEGDIESGDEDSEKQPDGVTAQELTSSESGDEDSEKKSDDGEVVDVEDNDAQKPVQKKPMHHKQHRQR